MSTNSATVVLYNTKIYIRLSNDISKDLLLNAIKEALKGCQSTADYFSKINSMQQLFQKIGD